MLQAGMHSPKEIHFTVPGVLGGSFVSRRLPVSRKQLSANHSAFDAAFKTCSRHQHVLLPSLDTVMLHCIPLMIVKEDAVHGVIATCPNPLPKQDRNEKQKKHDLMMALYLLLPSVVAAWAASQRQSPGENPWRL